MGASFIHADNIGFAAAIVCGFSAIHLYDRSRKPAFWWMLCFVGFLAMAVAEAVTPLFAAPPLSRFIVFALNMLAISCLNVGIAWHCEKPVPWRLIDGLLAGTLVCNFIVGQLWPGTLVESVVASSSLAVAQAIGLYILFIPGRGQRDRVFQLLLGLMILNYLSRPAIQGTLTAVSGDGLVASDVVISINNAMLTIGLATILTLRLAGRLFRDLKGQSETDSLSGLLNRHGFDLTIKKIRAQTESTTPTSLILCDLDRFKSINDEHGHYVGDRVIAAFGRLIRAGARDGDICGRFGGEEFCIYLRNSDIRAARLFAEWLRVAFASTSYPDLSNATRFTASFGVAEVVPGERIEDAYKRADAALYAAKHEGRNCVRTQDQNGGSSKLSGISFSSRSSRVST
ncbi:MAG: GGDEF domain-containing protein [Alphaproteobacteria bacterium]|nr:GGDEF domain-containing protein [Alphaproteobacteria bacterium]